MKREEKKKKRGKEEKRKRGKEEKRKEEKRKLEFSKDKQALVLNAESSELGKSEVELPAKIDGENVVIILTFFC